MLTTSLAANKRAEIGGTLDVGRKVAVDEVRIAGDHALEDVARDVRHPLADASQPDDAQRHLARAAERPRRQVMPAARHECRGDRRRRCGSAPAPAPARASRLRRCRSPANWPPRRRAARRPSVSIVSNPAPIRLTMPSSRQRGDDLLGDRRVLQQDAGTAGCGSDHFGLGPALRVDELDARAREELALEIDVGVIVIGEQDSRHQTRIRPHGKCGETVRWHGGPVKPRSPARRRSAAIIAAPFVPCRRAPCPTLLQTTIAGSLPKPEWLAAPGQLWAPWLLAGEALAEGKRDAVRLAALRPGARRASTSSPTASRRGGTSSPRSSRSLEGVDFEHKKTVRIRNRYDAAVPVVVGPVARRHPVFVDDARFLRSATAHRIKYTLPGPMTMVDTLYDAHYRSREKLAWAFAEILNEEARAIEAAGADVIQFDEPAFNVYFDEVRDWGVAALERAAQGLKCTTAVHICYGYGIKANIEWKKTLGSEWRQYEKTFPLLAALADHRPGLARVREFARAAGADRAAQGQGRPGRRDRRRDRPGRNARGGRGNDPRGARNTCPPSEALSLHQLRHGAARRARSPAASSRRSARGRLWFAGSVRTGPNAGV